MASLRRRNLSSVHIPQHDSLLSTANSFSGGCRPGRASVSPSSILMTQLFRTSERFLFARPAAVSPLRLSSRLAIVVIVVMIRARDDCDTSGWTQTPDHMSREPYLPQLPRNSQGFATRLIEPEKSCEKVLLHVNPHRTAENYVVPRSNSGTYGAIVPSCQVTPSSRRLDAEMLHSPPCPAYIQHSQLFADFMTTPL
ncbi:hypothetical protein B0H66DRAFT_599864 [Apodospora peruviana]|uniref:Uncharacterized protein n=1 Tax=Apodospora peruviana TaxID=516989 RepID=A0AAE0MB67_9PEZI|nr:hypothetical protein B0H66DRAFT_599864 [Apodospora peruviana]